MPRGFPAFARFQKREIAELAVLVAVAVLVSLPMGMPAAGGALPATNRNAPISFFGNKTTTNASSTPLNDSAATWNLVPTASATIPPVSIVGAWPTYEQNQQRTGKNAYENTISVSNASQLTRVWVHKLTAGAYGSLAVVNGTVYVGDYSGNESALYATNGSPLKNWPVEMAGSSGNYSFTRCFGGQNNVRGITETPTVWNNTVFVPADNNHLYALNANTGAVLPGWPVDMSNNSSKNDSWQSFYPWGSPLVYNGYVYIGVASGCDAPLVQGKVLQINITNHPAVVHHVDMANGAKSGGGIWSTPSLEAGTDTIWVTTGNCPTTSCTGSTQNWTQAFVALSGTNVCQPRGGSCTSKGYYHLTTGNDVDFGAGVTVYTLPWNGTPMVVATNKNGMAYAFFANSLSAKGTSSPAWSVRTSNPPPNSGGWNIAPAAFNGSTLFLAGSAVNSSNGPNCTGGSVRAVNLTKGTTLWASCAPGDVRAGLTYANGLVIDAADWTDNFGATVEVRNAGTGTVLDSITVNQTVNGEPVISNGRLFFGTGNWTLCGKAPSYPCPAGYVDAYGIPIGPYNSSMKPIYGGLAAPGFCGGVYSWGNASGGMANYNFTWAWGSSFYSYTKNAMELYCAGHFYPSLTITDAASEVATRMWSVTVYTYVCSNQTFPFCSITSVVPCITFGALHCYTGLLVQPVTLGARITWALAGVTWDWNFGDGSAHSSSLSPTHTYSAHGTYTATVTITNSEQVRYTQSFQVTV